MPRRPGQPIASLDRGRASPSGPAATASGDRRTHGERRSVGSPVRPGRDLRLPRGVRRRCPAGRSRSRRPTTAAAACSSPRRTARSGSSATASSSPIRCSTSRASCRPAASRACWGSRSTRTSPTTRGSSSTTPTSTATRSSPPSASIPPIRTGSTRGSATTILTVDQPFANHNGGAVAFGPDGYLYIALGDGGSGGDPQDNGQHLDTLLGKILRIDVDSPGAGGAAYAIPPDNPFADVSGARPEIWLTGLRNPWRFAFDRATGDLWIGDVGQGAWEEVDVAPAGVGGLDFGWDRMEGAHCFEPETGCPTDGLTLPVAEYGHEQGCTVIGGYVYRGAAQPVLAGGYLFGDYCTGPALGDRRRAARRRRRASGSRPGRHRRLGLAGFGEDEAGELYAANLDGTISRVVATPADRGAAGGRASGADRLGPLGRRRPAERAGGRAARIATT